MAGSITVRRIVANLATEEIDGLSAFYPSLFDLDTVMDLDWIVTLAGEARAPVQLALAREGGSVQPVPHFSVEVDDLDAVVDRARALGIAPDRGPVHEPWGVGRLLVTDPGGRIVNVLAHAT